MLSFFDDSFISSSFSIHFSSFQIFLFCLSLSFCNVSNLVKKNSRDSFTHCSCFLPLICEYFNHVLKKTHIFRKANISYPLIRTPNYQQLPHSFFKQLTKIFAQPKELKPSGKILPGMELTLS